MMSAQQVVVIVTSQRSSISANNDTAASSIAEARLSIAEGMGAKSHDNEHLWYRLCGRHHGNGGVEYVFGKATSLGKVDSNRKKGSLEIEGKLHEKKKKGG